MTILLNEFIQLTRYNRCYACQILNVRKEKVLGYLNIAGKRIKYVANKKKIKRKKEKIYDQLVLVALQKLWEINDHLKRKQWTLFGKGNEQGTPLDYSEGAHVYFF